MDSFTDDDGGIAVMDNHHSPRPPKPTSRKPSIHLDKINGRLIASEARTHLECLRDEEADALGATKRQIADRIWLWQMLVDELEGFHGISGGA